MTPIGPIRLIARFLDRVWMTGAVATDAGPGRKRRASPRWVTRLPRWLRQEQFGLFLLAAAGIFLLAPRFVVLGQSVLGEFLEGADLGLDLGDLPWVPTTLPIAVSAALGTFFLARRHRVAVLLLLVPPLAWLYGRLDATSILPLATFGMGAFALIRLPGPRHLAGIAVTSWTMLCLVLATRWLPNTATVAVLAIFPVLIPMLWYSVYEHGRSRLGFGRFASYMAGRFFDCPVFTYDDLGTLRDREALRRTRWAGVRAIYIALLASWVGRTADWAAGVLAQESVEGLQLLGASYVGYVGFYCRIVVRFNLFIGVLRLFGIPLRDNFRYWLLARTPNEHWQRWNLLSREWLITFVFYPIMRARRWLFVAIMAALITAGVLHIVPTALVRGFNPSRAVASTIYWIANGLAIYLVIKIPRVWPRLTERLRMPGSFAWSVLGVVLTSAFYSIIHGLRTQSATWDAMGSYLGRLIGLSG